MKKMTDTTVQISAPNFITATFDIVGTAPLVISKFSERGKQMMHDAHAAGSTTKKGAKKEPKDFQRCFREATYRAAEGWAGVNASGLRAAAISACRLVGFKMTLAKLSLFIEEDGWDGSTPLIRVTPEPEYFETLTRNASGVVDLRARPMWKPGWRASVRIRFDADQFTQTDVTNLIARIGQQVGIGEGRPDSKQSAGMGWGMFRMATEAEQKRKKAA